MSKKSKKITAFRTNFYKAESELADFQAEHSELLGELSEIVEKRNEKLKKYLAALRAEALARKDSDKDGNITIAYKEKINYDIDKLKENVSWVVLEKYGVEMSVSYTVDKDKIVGLVADGHIKKKELEAARSVKPSTAIYNAPKAYSLPF